MGNSEKNTMLHVHGEKLKHGKAVYVNVGARNRSNGNILKLDTPSMGSVGDGDSLVLLKADHLANSSILRISESNTNLKSNSSYVHIRGGSHLPFSNDSSIVKEVCQHIDAGLDQDRDRQKFWKCTYDYALLSAGSKNFMQGTAIDINTEKNKYATPMIIQEVVGY